MLGMEVPTKRQVEILQRLGLAPKVARKKIVCTIPPHRSDLSREVDLIEEVARLVGYDNIPVSQEITLSVAGEDLTRRTHRRVLQALSAAGFDEAVTLTFIDAEEAEMFGPAGAVQVDPQVRKTNNVLRATIVPSLLRVCKSNQDAGNGEVDLFELAGVFPPGEGAALPDEHEELAMVTTRDLRDLRGALEAVVERLAPAAKLELVERAAPALAEGASAEVRLDGEAVGAVGYIAPTVLEYYGLEREIASAAVRFDALLKRAGAERTYQPLPRFPAVQRDLSVIVEEAFTWRRLCETITAVDQPMRTEIRYVTTYRGKPIPAGRKSLTVTLIYRSPAGTLRSEQVDEQVEQVISALKKNLGAELRK
ncbi:MAG: hypothetical protein KAU28_02580, partial [Phycisphaerae bacterium]|nr:hypothetical protein [Phycisphaerae bacterium]